MLAPVTHILSLTNIRRARRLPVPGRVLVRTGAKVNATDVVAEAVIPSGHLILDVRRGLSAKTVSAAQRLIIRQEGERLAKGDVVAETSGMFARIMRAPVDADVVSVSGGMVVLRTSSKIMEVQAGFSGTVIEIIPDFGAVLETNGSLIQGVWGNGRMDSGMLLLVAQAPDEELTRPALDVSMRGAVVLAGHCSNQDALRAGNELPLRGLILSSMTANLVPYAQSLSYPIFVLEGFGKIPLNEVAYKLLTTSEKREISVNASFNASMGERPELVIPLPAAGQIPPEMDYFAPNQVVRIQGAPYAGRIGKIIQVRQGLETLPNGLRAPAADVQISSDTRAIVPLANLEVLK